MIANMPPAALITKRRQPKQNMAHGAMTCENATGLMGEYVAGDLSIESKRALKAHLSGCGDCTAFLRTYARTIELTKSFFAHSSFKTAPMIFRMKSPLEQ